MLYRGTRRIKKLVTNGAPAKVLVRNGRQIFPSRNPVRAMGPLEVRFTEEDGPNGIETWFEVGFLSSVELTGSAASGYQDPRLASVRLDFQHSFDLVTWTTGSFIDCADSPVDHGDGTFTYWGRSLYPRDSMEKSGEITAQLGAYDDTRCSPITSVTVAGVVLALPNFPYTMPTDAAQLQTDLRAAGFTGATVTASAATVWQIVLPTVDFTDYRQHSSVGWPVFFVPNFFGELVQPVFEIPFNGGLTNNAGVPTGMGKQFARTHP